MKKLLFTVLFIATCAISAQAQAECKQNGGTEECKLVTQTFIDFADLAFRENPALKRAMRLLEETVKAQVETIKAKDDRDEAKDAVVAIQKELLATKDKQIEKLIAVTCTKSSFFIFVYRSKKCF